MIEERLSDINQQLQAALQASERRFQLLVDVFPVMVFQTDAQGMGTFVNDAQWQEWTGLPAGAWADNGWWACVHPDDLAGVISGLQEVTAERTRWRHEFRLQHRDGRTFWMLCLAAPLFTENGHYLGHIGTCANITPQKETELQLHESEERYRELVEASPLGIAVHAQEKVVYINPEAVRLLGGQSADEFIGRSIWSFVHPDYQAEVQARIKKIYDRKDDVGILEEKFIRLDGQAIDVAVAATPVNYMGTPSSQVVFRDISQRKEAERQLQASEKRFRSIIEQSVDGIMLADESGKIIEWNQGMTHITGYSSEMIYGVTLSEITQRLMPPSLRPPDWWANVQAALAHFRKTREAPWFNRLEERTLQRADGSTRIVQALTFPITTDQGVMTGMVFRDITEKVEQDQQMRHQERMAAVGQLAAGIAHDFNNILAVIMLYADMLLRSPALPAAMAEPMQMITQQSARAAELTQQILDFSRRTILEKRVVDFRPLLENLTLLWQRTLPTSIQLTLNTGEDNVTIYADPTRLQQVLMNLVVNARDAMPDGGHLHLALERFQVNKHPFPELNPDIQQWVKITVQDSGTGIPPEMLPRLFEPFFTTKEPGKGTGLGLAQVYGIVKQHNGHIDVVSQVDRGTTFTLYFPAFLVQADVTNKLDVSGLQKGHHETILLIEDDDRVRQALASGLMTLNYQVIVARDGREGLEICRRRHKEIDLILCDMVMPHTSGYRLLNLLPEEVKTRPFVLMTGHPLNNLDSFADATGNDKIAAWITKPISLEELSHLLARLLPK